MLNSRPLIRCRPGTLRRVARAAGRPRRSTNCAIRPVNAGAGADNPCLMKVLHVTISFGHGGRREAISTLARGLQAMGIESHLCCLDGFDSDATGMAAFGSAVAYR